MEFKYLVRVIGGEMFGKWCDYFCVSGENMTIREALNEAEQTMDKDGYISSIEEVDEREML